MKLLTRQEIINIWLKNSRHLNYKCCPNCRNILVKEDDTYYCSNLSCDNTAKYSAKRVEKND